MSQTTSFDDLLNGIRTSEKKLLNLRVDSKCFYTEWDETKQDWQYVSETHETAWYDGKPGGKARVDTHKAIGRWEKGATPFAQYSVSATYDGRVGRQLKIESGPAGSPTETLEGEMTTNRPFFLEAGGGFSTGWPCSLYGCKDQLKRRLSEYLERWKKSPLAQCSVSSVQFQDRDCIKLVVEVRHPKFGQQKETWYFDPSRGYAILFDEMGWGREVTVEKLSEPAPGVFYPVRATFQSQKHGDRPKTKAQYEASAVVANDPNFSDDIFTINWPMGARVEDRVNGSQFTVGQSDGP
jgi:hypothetical protein